MTFDWSVDFEWPSLFTRVRVGARVWRFEGFGVMKPGDTRRFQLWGGVNKCAPFPPIPGCTMCESTPGFCPRHDPDRPPRGVVVEPG